MTMRPRNQQFVVVTDRGGHLHNALMLLDQMQVIPGVLISSKGPDVKALAENPATLGTDVHTLPHLFFWIGKKRLLNPFGVLLQFLWAGWWAMRIRPKRVVSLGATNTVFFCYWARLFGASIFHVECMNQVHSKSITGRLLYPICDKVFVQWKDLLSQYGPKEEYAGWVL